MECVQMRRSNNKKDLEHDIRNRNTLKSECNSGYSELSQKVKRGKYQFGKVKAEAVWIQIMGQKYWDLPLLNPALELKFHLKLHILFQTNI